MLAKLEASDFKGHENSDFEAFSDDGIVFLFRLKEVEIKRSISGHSHNTDLREPFSLFFKGPPGVNFSQGTVVLRHALFGDENVPVFMVAVGQDRNDPSSLTYQAVFN